MSSNDKPQEQTKQEPAPSQNTEDKSSQARRGSQSGHETTGAEKFAASGGSGGVPTRTGQGYEAYH